MEELGAAGSKGQGREYATRKFFFFSQETETSSTQDRSRDESERA